MLPAMYRMRRSPDFDTAVRRGRRAGRRTLVVHALSCSPVVGDPPLAAAKVGFVVSRAVGSSVVRSRVKRRLRAVVAGRLDRLPLGLMLVVRANPVSARASSADLSADFDAALGRALREGGQTGGGRA